MGTQVIKITFLTQPYFTLSFFKDGESNEGDEGHGSHEGNEGHEEEANLCPACQASCILRQDRQQEEERSRQAVSLDCSSPEGPQGTEDQGLRSCQEGHSTLQEGQGALCPVSALTNFQGLRSTSSRRGDIYVCRAPEPRFWNHLASLMKDVLDHKKK